MSQISRRKVIQGSIAGAFLLGLNEPVVRLSRRTAAAGPNSETRIGIIGLGGVDVVGGVGGRGRQLIDSLRKVPEARVVALCDVDETILGLEVEKFEKRGEQVTAHADFRRVLDDKNIDAVFIATPNHWHALATIWSCQASKDVYVEKPFSHNIWEGRQMIKAARKYERMVQVGTQRRSSSGLRQAFEFLQSGGIGAIRYARALIYRPRNGIGKVSAPTPVPTTLDYNLWCGPAPKTELMRKQLHYEWHWFWSTGNGEIGNNGAHEIDVCRWALGQNKPPPRAISIGGRFGFNDAGETPNTQIAMLDYQPAPLICEVRNWVRPTDRASIGNFKGIERGVVVQCEGGYFLGNQLGGEVFDKDLRKIKEFRDSPDSRDLEVEHVANFVQAVRSRDRAGLNGEALEGHLSAMCVHMANTSHRLGKSHTPEEILERTRSNRELSDSFERCHKYLQANGVDLANAKAVVGPWVTLDAEQERFIGEFGDEANQLSRRTYRDPFVVPELV